MAQDPDKPLDSGRVGLPPVDGAMNRRGPEPTKAKPRGKRSVAMRAGKPDPAADKEQELLAKFRKEFGRAVSAESDNRKNEVDDLKFLSGEGQWPPDVVSARNFDQRPCLTINKLPTFVNQVVNDQRMNRPAININPVGDKSDPEVAKMFRGMIRAIERDSSADIAYDTAFNSAVSVGEGYFRIMTEYAAPDSFNQVIVIKRIRNRFTVYGDPSRQEPDGADAKWWYITEKVPRKEFEEEWPDADPMPWTQGGFGEEYKEWITEHEIRIAERFGIEIEKKRLVMLVNGHVGYWDDLDDTQKTQEFIADRMADVPKVVWRKMTAKNILQERDWAGSMLPIVEVIGNEIDIEGKVRKFGLIRNAKSPQLMYNYHRTLSVELSSLQPKAPWIMEEGQVEGHETAWKQSNIKTLPYLLYRNVNLENGQAPPPQRQPFQGAPQAVLAEVQAAAQDIMAVTGIRFDATLGERVYDESGRALKELRERGDLGSFHYIDNLARSLRRCGEILVDLVPKIYDVKQTVTILREDDTEESVVVDPNAEKPFAEGKHPTTGKVQKIFNPTYGKYGVTVTIGPNYATKRIEAAESMMDFARALGPAAPDVLKNIADLIAKNMDWPDAGQIATRLSKMLPPNLLTPDMKDVPPQVQAMLSQMQQQVQALTTEKGQLVHALTEQQSDRAQRQDDIDKTFEAKLMGIIATFEAKMAAIEQKSEQATMDRIGGPLLELADGVRLLRERLSANDDDGIALIGEAAE